jgi:hypothetical protein
MSQSRAKRPPLIVPSEPEFGVAFRPLFGTLETPEDAARKLWMAAMRPKAAVRAMMGELAEIDS